MAKYKILARTIIFKDVGVFEANSEEEAIDMASEGDTELTLCHHCHKDVSGIELEVLIAEEV